MRCGQRNSRPSKANSTPTWVAIATTIIKRRAGTFDPIAFRDRYQEALRELAEAKLKGHSTAAQGVSVTTLSQRAPLARPLSATRA